MRMLYLLDDTEKPLKYNNGNITEGDKLTIHLTQENTQKCARAQRTSGYKNDINATTQKRYRCKKRVQKQRTVF